MANKWVSYTCKKCGASGVASVIDEIASDTPLSTDDVIKNWTETVLMPEIVKEHNRIHPQCENKCKKSKCGREFDIQVLRGSLVNVVGKE